MYLAVARDCLMEDSYRLRIAKYKTVCVMWVYAHFSHPPAAKRSHRPMKRLSFIKAGL